MTSSKLVLILSLWSSSIAPPASSVNVTNLTFSRCADDQDRSCDSVDYLDSSNDAPRQILNFAYEIEEQEEVQAYKVWQRREDADEKRLLVEQNATGATTAFPPLSLDVVTFVVNETNGFLSFEEPPDLSLRGSMIVSVVTTADVSDDEEIYLYGYQKCSNGYYEKVTEIDNCTFTYEAGCNGTLFPEPYYAEVGLYANETESYVDGPRPWEYNATEGNILVMDIGTYTVDDLTPKGLSLSMRFLHGAKPLDENELEDLDPSNPEVLDSFIAADDFEGDFESYGCSDWSAFCEDPFNGIQPPLPQGYMIDPWLKCTMLGNFKEVHSTCRTEIWPEKAWKSVTLRFRCQGCPIRWSPDGITNATEKDLLCFHGAKTWQEHPDMQGIWPSCECHAEEFKIDEFYLYDGEKNASAAYIDFSEDSTSLPELRFAYTFVGGNDQLNKIKFSMRSISGQDEARTVFTYNVATGESLSSPPLDESRAEFFLNVTSGTGGLRLLKPSALLEGFISILISTNYNDNQTNELELRTFSRCSVAYTVEVLGSEERCQLGFTLGCFGQLYPAPQVFSLVLTSSLEPGTNIMFPAVQGPIDEETGTFSYEAFASYDVLENSPKGLEFQYEMVHGPEGTGENNAYVLRNTSSHFEFVDTVGCSDWRPFCEGSSTSFPEGGGVAATGDDLDPRLQCTVTNAVTVEHACRTEIQPSMDQQKATLRFTCDTDCQMIWADGDQLADQRKEFYCNKDEMLWMDAKQEFKGKWPKCDCGGDEGDGGDSGSTTTSPTSTVPVTTPGAGPTTCRPLVAFSLIFPTALAMTLHI